jgi:Raf kinase inhibitor-like YbhB/YbcL family protein
MPNRSLLAITLMLLVSASLALFAQAARATDPEVNVKLISTAFSENGTIGREFTCDGEDRSPQLAWSAAPEKAAAYALIVDDPDAPVGTWVHWVYYDLPAKTSELPEAVEKAERPKTGGIQGRNDFGRIGYGGPCPPPGKPHRYFFKLYALDRQLGLKPGAKKADIERAMQGHIIAQGQLVGTYGRAK